MKEIFLGMVVLSSVVLADFSRSREGIVTDNTTTLQWQDDYSDNGDTIKKASWQSAIDYCENLTLGDYDDWRLPNVRELISLQDYTRALYLIDPVFQNVVTSSYNSYWSSTTSKVYSNRAWGVKSYSSSNNGFSDGRLNKGSSYYVRCVRGGE